MRTIHMSIDLRGALMNWEDRLWRNCVTADDGHTMSPKEVKMEFLQQLSEGKKVIPMNSSCDNFDFQKGCLGHETHSDQTQNSPALQKV